MTPIDSPPTQLSARAWPYACGLVLIVFVVFGAAAGFGFLNWDDPQQVRENPNVNPPSWQGVRASWQAPYWNLYIPLSYTVLAFEAAIAERVDPVSGLSELRPSVFHVGNLLLHAACTLLVFVLLRRLLGANVAGTLRVPSAAQSHAQAIMADGTGTVPATLADGTGTVPATLIAAGLGALLFAVHPLQVESVAWISEVRGLLCGLFAVLALWQYVEYADGHPAPGTTAFSAGCRVGRTSEVRAMLYAGATAALVLALLSKPAAVAVPLMAGVLGVGLLRRRLMVVFLEMLPWIACAIVAIAKTKQLQPGTALAFVPSLAVRPLVALDAIGFYVAKFFVPLQLGADYGRTPPFVLGGKPFESFQIGGVLLPVLLIAFVLVKHRRMPLVGSALFLAWLAPVLGLVSFDFQRISTVADRYVYLAMLGPALVVAWIVQRWWSLPLAGVAAATIGLLGALSFLQLGTWRDTQTLFEHALRVNPRSAVAQYHLGYLAFLDGRRDDAIDWYRKSLELRPDFVLTHVGLAKALFVSGDVEAACNVLRETKANGPDARFVQEVLQAFQSKQQGLVEAAAEINLGVAEAAAGRFEKARLHYLAAIRIEPRLAKAYYNLGNLAYAERNWSQAIEHFETALKCQPEYAEARANLGAALMQSGRLQNAITQERAALIIDPSLLPAHTTLGQALLRSGSKDEAAAEFRKALDQIPFGSPQAANIRSWLRKAEADDSLPQ